VTWLGLEGGGSTAFESVLGMRPELLSAYREFYGRLWDGELAPLGLLELCRLRIAQLHACDAELAIRIGGASPTQEQVIALNRWRSADCFSPVARAALSLAEKVPWSPHEVTDEDMTALRSQLPEKQVIALVIAIALFDANCRMKLALGVKPQPMVVDRPASRERLY
jgi:alkylhydroperoxidase family enzyme